MELGKAIKNGAIRLLQQFSSDIWVEIKTDKPDCIYYFGPFNNSIEAQQAYPGYLEDLEGEGAQGIKVTIKHCNPSDLTISPDLA